MATILSSKKSTGGSPYCFYTVEASTSDRKPTSVKVTMKVTARLQYSTSWLGTGIGLRAGFYVGGEWHNVTLKSTSSTWSGTGAHTETLTFTVSGLSASATALKDIRFRCIRSDGGSASELSSTSCSNISISSVTNKYSDVAIKVDEDSVTQAKATIILSGLPKSVGYATEIRWYRNGDRRLTTSRSATATSTTASCTFGYLEPNTTYTFKAAIYHESTLLKSKTITVTTEQETGTLTLTPHATYITVTVSDMFDEPNYTRGTVLSYKKDEDSDYTTLGALKGQGESVSTTIKNLISNSTYDVKVMIQNGDTVLKTLKASTTTLEDTSLMPTAFVESIIQWLGTRQCEIYWDVSKKVAGTTYTIEAMGLEEDSPAWEELTSISEVTSPITVESPSGNMNVSFRIKAVNESVAEELPTYSEEFVFYVRDDFFWDSDKVAGQPLIITANEWNRLREYVLVRSAVDVPTVRQGDSITAEIYNTMKNAISVVTPIDIADKRSGDAITAADIDALRIAINTV